jgi:hypothetical protein
VSLFETAIGLLPYQVTAYLSGGAVPGRHGTAFPLISPYQVFRVRDAELMIAAGNDGLFRRLCDALDLHELAEDARFATNPDRVSRREELAALIQERVRDEPLAGVLAGLERAGVPAAPVNDVGQAAGHEQTAALGLIQDLPLPTVALPLSVDGESAGGSPPGRADRPGGRRRGTRGCGRPGHRCHAQRSLLRFRHRRRSARGVGRGLADVRLGSERRLYVGGPAASIVEQVVREWVCDLLGLPEDASLGLVTGTQMGSVTALEG